MTTQFEATAPTESGKPGLLAYVSLVVALIAVSFAAIFIRFSETEIGADATVFNRFLIFALVFGAARAVRAFRRSLTEAKVEPEEPPTGKQWLLLLSVGAISTTSLVLWALSLTMTTVANSVLLNNLTPIFTTLGGWLCLGQRFDRRFVLGLVIAMTGAIAIGVDDLTMGAGSTGEDSFAGDVFALLSAVFLGSYFLVAEQLRGRFSATTILLWRCTLGGALLIPVVWLAEDAQFFPQTSVGWLSVVGLGLVCEGLGQRLLADSLNRISSGFIALFLLLEPLTCALLAWLIFAETLSWSKGFFFAIVLGGIYLAQSSDCTYKAVPVPRR